MLSLFPRSDLDRDWQIRLTAFDALKRILDRSGGVITREEMSAGFEFEGERIRFANTQVGIWRPRQLAKPLGAALSITTVATKKGTKPKYDDDIGSDGWFEYRYQGTDPNDWDNVAVRTAAKLQRPLIYFYGVVPGIFEALYPTYVVGDEPERLTFLIASDAVSIGAESLLTGGSPEALKAYATRTVKQRLHQHRFRELVLGAYEQKCAVCTLGTNNRLLRLLDAAHILPDRDERGKPEVPNGLSLCKIHHSAYDLNILGLSPDGIVHIRHDILNEVDGPMLQHGIKEMSGREMKRPRRVVDRPNPDYLAVRFEEFLAA